MIKPLWHSERARVIQTQAQHGKVLERNGAFAGGQGGPFFLFFCGLGFSLSQEYVNQIQTLDTDNLNILVAQPLNKIFSKWRNLSLKD